MANQNEELLLTEADFDYDALEQSLEKEFNEKNLDLELAVQDREKIGNPQCLVEAVGNVAWDQFLNMAGPYLGEDFIKENRGLTLDLSNDAHIQTVENFEKGIIAEHNYKVDYQKRYDDFRKNFQTDPNIEHKNGNYRYNDEQKVWEIHDSRSSSWKIILKKNARHDFDKNRLSGSKTNNTQMDHIIPVAEIISDTEAATYLTREEQVDFANSDINLNLMDSSANQSKKDSTMSEWLDSERYGKRPADRFNIDEKDLRKKDSKAREMYTNQKKEAEARQIKEGIESQKKEKNLLEKELTRSVVMTLLAALMKEILQKLVAWFRAGKRNISTFIDALKESLKSFFSNIIQYFIDAGKVLITTILVAIKPIVGTIKKAWMLLKQGYKSFKETVNFFKNPANQNMPFSIKVMAAGKILIAGLTAGGAILLSEVIEKGLMAVHPLFAYPIPFLGSLASLLGLFFGALVSAIIGAIGLNLIDKLIANKQRALADKKIIETGNEVLLIQSTQLALAQQGVKYTKERVEASINARHTEAVAVMKDEIQGIRDASDSIQARDEQIFDEQRENQMSEDFDAALQRIRNILK